MSDIFRVPKDVEELAKCICFYMGLEFLLELFIYSKPKDKAKNTLLNIAKLLHLSDGDVERIRSSVVYPVKRE